MKQNAVGCAFVRFKFPVVWFCQNQTSNLSKAHVTRDSNNPATLAITVGLQQ